jgi:hypothetical protein
MTTIKMTEDDYTSMTFGMGSPGMCLACGDVDEYAGCEPDAEGYECHGCGEMKLTGLEVAMVMGHVEIV